MSKISDIPQQIAKLWKFITEDVWRMSFDGLSTKRQRGYNLIKVIVLAFRRFQEDNLQRNASALTYSSLLSLVPMLAVLLSIAKGFGFNNIVESQLFNYFPGQKEALTHIFEFVDSYMSHSKDGLFFGLGLVLLLYTVINLISTVEDNFNKIWQVQKGRSYTRRITDYFSILIILPVFLICASGISIFMTTTMDSLMDSPYFYISSIYNIILKIVPLIVSIFAFTALYIYLPNTKVKFRHAFYAGIFAGIGFQLFQFLYVSGQMWVSKYNAIYGSFAFLPLLLLWMQLSWTICLLGAEIAYAGQNVRNYEFETDSKNITQRYNDFLILTIMTLIVKRFQEENPPYTVDEISIEYKIPIRLTSHILFYLVDLGLVNEIKDDDQYPNYQPALDINKITIRYLFEKIDTYGSENFFVDKNIKFRNEWQSILKLREDMYAIEGDKLLKDL